MDIQFEVSAPGKVILFGEHSVVYGKTAVASSINLRTTFEFKELSNNENCIHLSMPETQLDKRIAVDKIQKTFFNKTPLKHTTDRTKFREEIELFVQSIGFEGTAQKLCLEAILYLSISIFQSQGVQTLKPFFVHGKTELPIGSGLGSSASFAVCIATCFLHYCNILSEKETTLNEDTLTEISNYAFDCERIMHGTPSGIDNAICTFGSMIEFRKGESPSFIPCNTGMRVILVNSNVPRSTKALVEKVKNSKTKYPRIFESILDSMDGVAMEASKLINRMENVSRVYDELSQLMEINQGLLSALGVSHPTLDTICLESKNRGFSAKLTGAGGGGFAYILLSENSSSHNIDDLCGKLSDHGFTVVKSILGGNGVRIN